MKGVAVIVALVLAGCGSADTDTHPKPSTRGSFALKVQRACGEEKVVDTTAIDGGYRGWTTSVLVLCDGGAVHALSVPDGV